MADGVGRIVPPAIAPGQTEHIRRERQRKNDGEQRPKPQHDVTEVENDSTNDEIAAEKDLVKGQRLNINV
jgi:hypothetical protein